MPELGAGAQLTSHPFPLEQSVISVQKQTLALEPALVS